MTEQKYSAKESLNRIFREAIGQRVVSDIPGEIPEEVFSEDETLSKIAELLADSLPNENFYLPTPVRIGVGNNYVSIDRDGEIVLEGTSTVWDDIRVPLSSIKRLGFADPDWEQFQDNGTGSVGVYAPAFSNTVDQEVYFAIQIPHDWKLGTDLNPHVHWSPSNTDTGDVTWKLEYTVADMGSAFGTTATLAVTQAGSGTDREHQYADLGDIDMSSYTDPGDVSIMLLCRLYRDVSDGDDYNADAFLLETDFHYQKDSLGSKTELSK